MATPSRYSNAMHWCSICRAFIQNNARSIAAHEQGLRHAGAVKRRLEKAAWIKDKSVAQQNRGFFQPPPQPIEEEIQHVVVKDSDILGQYSVRGTTYFQGEYHEDLLLLPSSACQVSLLDEDGEPGTWIRCTVAMFDPTEKTYLVNYKPDENSGEESAHVMAADIRIIGPAEPQESITSWAQVQNQAVQEEPAASDDDITEVVNKPQVEYYKGVAVIGDDEMSAVAEAQSAKKASGPIVFKKRARTVKQAEKEETS